MNQIETQKQKLEREAAGILNWIVAGLKHWEAGAGKNSSGTGK